MQINKGDVQRRDATKNFCCIMELVEYDKSKNKVAFYKISDFLVVCNNANKKN